MSSDTWSLLRIGVLASLPALAAGFCYSVEATPSGLRSANAFASIKDERERSLALFNEAGKVIQHPRCTNCHPAGARPFQGDDSHPHKPSVARGADDFGAVGMRCTTCHGQTNFNAAHVPGNPKWHLAPIEMAWMGKSLGAICEQIKDPARNGGRTLNDIVDHMANDDLVGWGWKPDAGRTPAPGTQAEFGELIKLWVKSGAYCPAP